MRQNIGGRGCVISTEKIFSINFIILAIACSAFSLLHLHVSLTDYYHLNDATCEYVRLEHFFLARNRVQANIIFPSWWDDEIENCWCLHPPRVYAHPCSLPHHVKSCRTIVFILHAVFHDQEIATCLMMMTNVIYSQPQGLI